MCCSFVVGCFQVYVYLDYVVLLVQCVQVLYCVLFVVVECGGVGEVSCDFVFLDLGVLGFVVGVCKFFELLVWVVYVGWCFEDDVIGCGQCCLVGFGEVVFGVDGYQLSVSGVSDCFGDFFCVVVVGVVENDDFVYGGFFLQVGEKCQVVRLKIRILVFWFVVKVRCDVL